MLTRIQFTMVALSLLLSLGARADDQKEWTFLVFLNANNNLDSFSTTNMEQMEKVGSTKDVNIVVQWASMSAGDTKRILVQKSTDPNSVTSPVVENLGKVDMGDYKNFISFVNWGVQHYPAKKYFVSIWDHGSGWHAIEASNKGGLHLTDFNMHVTDISWDENTGNSITTLQMSEAMTEIAHNLGHKIDLYGSDACLMAMAELGAQLQDSVNVYAGSQETEPGAGWPYDKFLAQLVAKPTMDARELGTILVNAYTKSYEDGSQPKEEVTFSAMDLRNYPAFMTAMQAFSAEMIAAAPTKKAAIITTAGNAQGFTYTDYKDLIDTLNQFDKTPTAGTKATRDKLRAATQQMIVANATTPSFVDAHGMSFWMPVDANTYDAYKATYDSLVFTDTHWNDALGALLQ